MGTENKAVSVYLPKDLEDKINEYCMELKITRKDRRGEVKPMFGTAIVEILRQYFALDNLPSKALGSLPNEESIKNVVYEVLKDEKTLSNLLTTLPVNDLPDNVVTDDKLTDAIANLKKEFLPVVEEREELAKK